VDALVLTQWSLHEMVSTGRCRPSTLEEGSAFGDGPALSGGDAQGVFFWLQPTETIEDYSL
jgi:hypothetical protein